MLKQRNQRFDKSGRLIKDKYYLGNLLVFKYIVSYPDAPNDFPSATTWLFGILPLGKINITSEMLLSKSVRGGGHKSKKYFLDASHPMAQDIAKSTYQDNVKENIERLCAGLDEQSVQCVNRILARLKMSYSVKDKRIYRLTSEEKEVLQEIEQEFYPNIIPLKDCYFYNGFFLPKGDLVEFGVSVFWHNHGLTNIKHWDRIADKNIIDVGGFIGDSALILQKYTKAKIYSFEALSDNYDLMLKTIILNKTDKIIPIKKALGAEFDKLKIYKYGSGSSMAIAKSEDYEEVEVITLDSFVQENDIKVGFIKVDIEGFEMPFLQGALETIKAQKPAMLLSIYHQASDFFGIKPFLEDLGLGYKFKVYKPIDRSVSGETCLFCEVDSES